MTDAPSGILIRHPQRELCCSRGQRETRICIRSTKGIDYQLDDEILGYRTLEDALLLKMSTLYLGDSPIDYINAINYNYQRTVNNPQLAPIRI